MDESCSPIIRRQTEILIFSGHSHFVFVSPNVNRHFSFWDVSFPSFVLGNLCGWGGFVHIQDKVPSSSHPVKSVLTMYSCSNFRKYSDYAALLLRFVQPEAEAVDAVYWADECKRHITASCREAETVRSLEKLVKATVDLDGKTPSVEVKKASVSWTGILGIGELGSGGRSFTWCCCRISEVAAQYDGPPMWNDLLG